MSTPHERLEHELRDAAHDFDAVAASPGAWQDNQRRLAGDRSRRSRMALGAAVAVTVLAVVGAVALRGGSDPGVPATGNDDPFATEYLLGEPVELETVTINSGSVVHEAALSDMTGDGPRLCDRYVGVTDAPVCVDRDPGADDEKIAVDWLTAYGPESPRRGVVVGVDRRVSFLDVWLTDGTRVEAALQPGGWDGSRLTGLTVPAGDPGPQRLVAHGRDGNVLQAIDLVARFGAGWLDQRSACASDPVAELSADGEQLPTADFALGTTDALVTARLSADHNVQTCVERLRGSAVAAQVSFGRLAVVVLAPETELVGVQVDAEAVAEIKPRTVQGTLWRVAVLGGFSPGELAEAQLVAYDRHGLELDRVYVSQPMTP